MNLLFIDMNLGALRSGHTQSKIVWDQLRDPYKETGTLANVKFLLSWEQNLAHAQFNYDFQ